DQAITHVHTVGDLLVRSGSEVKFNLLSLSLVAVVALALAAIGVYGVMSYAVTQRTLEIGVRMALGAQPGSVLRLVIGQGMTLVSAGVVIGVAAAWGLTRVVATMLVEKRAADPATFAAVALFLAPVGAPACWD